MKKWYGLLVGLVYTVPFALTGLVAGKMSDKVNRKLFLGVTIILSSITFGVAGAVNSFAVFAIMRGLQAAICSAVSPLAYSIVNDTFPQERRSSANSLIASCFNLGEGLSSFSILLISLFGWRSLYGTICALGVLLGINILAFIREPDRGKFQMASLT